MATLEKIRQQKKWLAIVIGAALIAFIIEVGVEAIGRSGGNSAAAKVGNEKIDIMAFQRQVEQEAANDQQNDPSIDAATRQQEVLEQMISDRLLEQEFEKLGITVSDWEISQLMIGKNPAPSVTQFAQQAGAKSPAELYDFIMNPSKQGVSEAQVAELRNQWEKLKSDIVKQYKFAKLQNLLAGCMQANDLDRTQLMADEAITNVVTFAKKDYESLPDDKYPVSDEELKAEWEKMKPMFKTEEDVRHIHYIAVNIEPNAEDIMAANKVADAAYIALQKGRGVDSVRLLGTVKIDTAKMVKKEFPATVQHFANAEVGATHRDSVANNHHVMYKLINKEMSIDSVDLGYVIVQGDTKMQKSVMDQLNSGKSLDDIKKAYPQKVDGKLSEWQRIFNAPDSMKTKIANATPGTYFVYNGNENGATLLKVNDRKAPKMFYTLATITYDAYASTKTSEQLRDKFQDFLNKNKTVKDFEENAAKAGFNAVDQLITPSTPQLGAGQFGRGIKDSRKAIKWAFDNKVGDVSPIFSDNNDVMVAVAIDDVYNDGYLPYTYEQGKNILTRRVRNSKKGDDLMKQYQGKANDLNGYAALMGEKVDTVNIVFTSNGDPKLGNESGLIGRMAVAQPGKLQGPWKGDNAVFVYQVVKQDKSERKPSKEELDSRYSQTRGAQIFANSRAIQNILTKATKVKKHLIDFY
ncbi:MAG: SurA N-terminal domain-containing protein [Muribaculaceae bacterium]|nr:SurA N-terminal domain-containing protein [Muribaculaceae bacterium]